MTDIRVTHTFHNDSRRDPDLHLTVGDDTLTLTSTDAETLVANLGTELENVHARASMAALLRSAPEQRTASELAADNRAWHAARQAEEDRQAADKRDRKSAKRSARAEAIHAARQAEESARWAARAVYVKATEQAKTITDPTARKQAEQAALLDFNAAKDQAHRARLAAERQAEQEFRA